MSLSDKLTRPWPVYMETARAMRRRSTFRAFNATAYGRDHGVPIRNPYAAGAPMSDLFGGQHDMGGQGTTDHQAAQSNSLALAVPSPDLDDRSDAWMRHRRVWRGVASIIHRNNARRAFYNVHAEKEERALEQAVDRANDALYAANDALYAAMAARDEAMGRADQLARREQRLVTPTDMRRKR